MPPLRFAWSRGVGLLTPPGRLDPLGSAGGQLDPDPPAANLAIGRLEAVSELPTPGLHVGAQRWVGAAQLHHVAGIEVLCALRQPDDGQRTRKGADPKLDHLSHLEANQSRSLQGPISLQPHAHVGQ